MFPGPVTGRPRRPLSIRAFYRFLQHTLLVCGPIISGAPSSSSLFRRLLRLIILLYKSFRSEGGQNGLRPAVPSGADQAEFTGIASIIIHSGLFPEPRRASTTSERLMIRARFCPLASRRPAFSSADSFSRSIACSSSLMDSAPFPRGNGFHISRAYPDILSLSVPAYTEARCLPHPVQYRMRSKAPSPGYVGTDPDQSHPAGDSLKIPDVGNRSSQLNMPHTLTAHIGLGDLNAAAAVADHAFVPNLFIFSTVTLPVLAGSEDSFAEQAVFSGFRVL